ncbi:MAG: hypothetical protein D6730_14845 [Bacteroidetes bacterium]|nr:MAG: hypothetical protein D6730_14845 [Bacteroidota bacterium]
MSEGVSLDAGFSRNFLPYNSVDAIFNMLPLRIVCKGAKSKQPPLRLCVFASNLPLPLCEIQSKMTIWPVRIRKLIVAPIEDFDTLYEQTLWATVYTYLASIFGIIY